jgi:hypothetical protein
MMLASVPLTRGPLNIYGDQSFVVCEQRALDVSTMDSPDLTRHSLSSSIRLLFFFATPGGGPLMLRHNDIPTDQSPSLKDGQLRKMVNDACVRIQVELTRRAPFLGLGGV